MEWAIACELLVIHIYISLYIFNCYPFSFLHLSKYFYLNLWVLLFFILSHIPSGRVGDEQMTVWCSAMCWVKPQQVVMFYCISFDRWEVVALNRDGAPEMEQIWSVAIQKVCIVMIVFETCNFLAYNIWRTIRCRNSFSHFIVSAALLRQGILECSCLFSVSLQVDHCIFNGGLWCTSKHRPSEMKSKYHLIAWILH